MTTSAVPQEPLAFDAYLELEASATVRHELVGGALHALAGASSRHNRVAGNVFALLWNAARGGPCRVYMSDMKLRVADDVVYYPDVMVLCTPPVEDNPIVEHDPCLVVEVLSPATEHIDRREKRLAYQHLPSVAAYLVISQDTRRVERHFRDEHGRWRSADLVGAGQVPVPCPEGAMLTVEDIYEGL